MCRGVQPGLARASLLSHCLVQEMGKLSLPWPEPALVGAAPSSKPWDMPGACPVQPCLRLPWYFLPRERCVLVL